MSPLPGSDIAAEAVNDAQRIHKLPILVLMTHSRCNCRCVMCDIWKASETRELGLAQLAPHLGAIRELGVEWVVFSGGEPLMNVGLFSLARALREMKIRLILLTTGLLLGKYVEEVASNMDEVIVSLDGPVAIHNAIRRVPRAFETMAEGIRRLKSVAPGIPIRARMTVQRANHTHLCETVAAAQKLGLSSISFLAADVTSTAFNRELVWPTEKQQQIALAASEVSALEDEMAAIVRDYGSEIASGFIAESPAKLRQIVRHFRAQLGLEAPVAPVCNAPWVSAVVEADGRVRPCFFHSAIGNIHDANLGEVLNSDAALDFRAKLQIASNPICRRCVCSLKYESGDR
jgi:MoaA/NifB/PqqE/SkfB family radical SAM enzyme